MIIFSNLKFDSFAPKLSDNEQIYFSSVFFFFFSFGFYQSFLYFLKITNCNTINYFWWKASLLGRCHVNERNSFCANYNLWLKTKWFTAIVLSLFLMKDICHNIKWCPKICIRVKICIFALKRTLWNAYLLFISLLA